MVAGENFDLTKRLFSRRSYIFLKILNLVIPSPNYPANSKVDINTCIRARSLIY